MAKAKKRRTVHIIFQSADDDKVHRNVIHSYTKGGMRRFLLDEKGPDGGLLLMKYPLANIFSEANTHRKHYGSTQHSTPKG